MTIKEVAEKTGITTDNLRYYERIGLIPPVPRKESGIRDFNEESLLWIEFAMRFKKSGISLESIIEYIRLAMLGDSTRVARKEILIEARDNIVQKMAEMQDFLDLANYKIDHYYSDILPATDERVNDWKKANEIAE